MITLGLLEVDVLYDDLIPDYGSYGKMFEHFFESLKGGLQYRYYEVQKGEFPQALNECDAYLITGSKAGVYELLPWVSSLQDWIKDFYQRGARLTGICFGHQILAHSLGGYAEKSNRGWGVGLLETQLFDDRNLFLGNYVNKGDSIKLLHSHQDQVVKLPEEAQCLTGNDFCPIAAMGIGKQVLSFQGHPEFTPEYFRRLISRRKENIGQDRFVKAMRTLENTTDHKLIGQVLLDFIHCS